MKNKNTDNWYKANQHYLMTALRVVQEELKYYSSTLKDETKKSKSIHIDSASIKKELEQAGKNLPGPAALDLITSIFGLSSFERKTLLMCAGVDLDSNFASLVALVQGNSNTYYPSFSLALAAFKDAHWSALSPDAPLRYWRLINIKTNQLISKSPLQIDERILHYLTGVQHLDEKLIGIVEPYYDQDELVPSHKEIADRIVKIYSSKSNDSISPVIQINGSDIQDKLSIAANACAQLGFTLYTISLNTIPNNLKDNIEFIRLWNRESTLGRCAIFLDCDDIDTTDITRLQLIKNICNNVQDIIFISTHQWNPKLKRQTFICDVFKPITTEQYSVWEKLLGTKIGKPDGELDKLVSQFNLSTHSIYKINRDIQKQLLKDEGSSADEFNNILWQSCCNYTRPKLDDLAQRITPMARWDDLILPEFQKSTLKEIAMQVRQERKVYETWGFAAKSSRGLGISVLFTGDSGTGKTMASEVIANELHLDLYRIDLSQVVNKYIGETEKNLKRIFDAAEDGGAILLFDEADALFGKRSEVKDSHDRYANIEVSYLLQRMEAYRGLAILTTNMKSALDKAFLRRLRFIVHFPFPDAVQRAEIWDNVFPDDTPVEKIDAKKLAHLNITGGNIRNIALSAAFIAADKGESVSMTHISRAAKSEYAKLEKPMSTVEAGVW